MIYQFADLKLDQGKRQLIRGKKVIKLPKLSFDFLSVLVEFSPNIVTQDELIDNVWGEGRIVTPENITQRINLLRKSLDDHATDPVYIDVIHGQGVKLIPAVDIIENNSQPKQDKKKKSNWLPIVTGISALIVLFKLLLPIYSSEELAPKESAILPMIDLRKGPSIAVLPFVNMSSDKENQFFSDGITEEIIHSLVRQTSISVTDKTSSVNFRKQNVDAQDIEQHLNVSHLLEGSVRKTNDMIRISIQLIDAPTGLHIWSEQYDRSIDNLFEVQSEIAANVVEEIKRQLVAQGENRLNKLIRYKPIQNMNDVSGEAYQAYLNGKFHKKKMIPKDISLAITYFEEATQLSPKFIEAWEELIETKLLSAGFAFSLTNSGDALAKIEKWLEIALPLYPDNIYLLGVRGYILAFYHYQWDEGLGEIEALLPKASNNARALSLFSYVYFWTLRLEVSDNLAYQSLELEPDSPSILDLLSWRHYELGEVEKSHSILNNPQYEYFFTVRKVTLNIIRREPEQLDKNIRILRKYIKADTPLIQTFQAWLHKFNGEDETSQAMGDKLVKNMLTEPISIQWVGGHADNRDYKWEIAEQQRHPAIAYWIIMATKFKNIPPEKLPPRLASYYKKLNLVNLPDGNYKPSNQFNSVEQKEIDENELSVPVSVLEKYAGIYKNGIITLEVTIKDNRLIYRRLYSNGYLSAVSEQKFISSNIKYIELEFFANDSGEFDLCVFKNGEMTWFGYKVINKEVNKVTTD
jgi:TolB-like protein/DNA-binding winged helix-turn-helix (wHTH) protein